MKQILIISGKGGTGKTVMAGAFSAIAGHAVIVDCDVDAANLHLLLKPTDKERNFFKCGFKAYIDRKKCSRCGLCRTVCRFEAVTKEFTADPILCEGCSFCMRVCPAGAIEMREDISGEWFVSETRFGTFVHARLGIAKENSGKLVSLIKKKAKELGEAQGCDWMIVDGAPGIGCPVIASLSGVSCALVVTEPTLSGLHDADRVIQVARHFNVPVKFIINKYDLNVQVSQKIEVYARDQNIPVIGKIPFHRDFIDATLQGKTIFEFSDDAMKHVLRGIWDQAIGS